MCNTLVVCLGEFYPTDHTPPLYCTMYAQYKGFVVAVVVRGREREMIGESNNGRKGDVCTCMYMTVWF